MYIKRLTHQTLLRFKSAFPVVSVTGPRQSGKSTFLQHSLPDYTYVTFDEEFNIASFESDPKAFLAQYQNRVIFDEVQFVPKLFNMIKVAVDNDRQNYGRYILTGSSQFSFLQNVSESLAGRIGLMTQLPLQFSEMPKALLSESIYQGAYPELVLRDYREAELWYASYLDTYLTKDVRTLTQIGDMRDFRQLIRLLASNVSQTLDMTSYASAIGVSVPTIKRWLSVLEASYIVFLLPPYYNNMGKRITKSPKIYFYDTGLVSYLTGIKNYDLYDKGPMAGALFENYIVSEIKKMHCHSASHAELYFLRTQDKAEIDLIVDNKQTRDLIEIKKSSTYMPKFARHLNAFAKPSDRKIVLYQGDTLKQGEVDVLFYADYLTIDNPVD
jgi:uncharacterized protein